MAKVRIFNLEDTVESGILLHLIVVGNVVHSAWTDPFEAQEVFGQIVEENGSGILQRVYLNENTNCPGTDHVVRRAREQDERRYGRGRGRTLMDVFSDSGFNEGF